MTLKQLFAYFKASPDAEKIAQLRSLVYDSKEYKDLKSTFDYITPHGTFDKREDEGLNKLSGLFYFDIDAKATELSVPQLKEMILANYADKISMLGTSIGGKGIFFYVRTNDKKLTADNFSSVHFYFRTEVFKELPLDANAGGLSRPQFITHDEQLYFNNDCIVAIPAAAFNNTTKVSTTFRKTKDKPVNATQSNYTRREELLDICEVSKNIVWQTQVEVEDAIVDVKPVKFLKAYFAKRIKDGYKHKTFKALTNSLTVLNPGVSLLELQSLMCFINERHTEGEPMEFRNLMRIVEYAYNTTMKNPEPWGGYKTKNVHFNKNCGKSGDEKKAIANVIIGKMKSDISFEKINAAYSHLKNEGIKITQKMIAELSGLCIATVKRHWKKFKETIITTENEIETINKEQPIKLILMTTNNIEIENLFELSDEEYKAKYCKKTIDPLFADYYKESVNTLEYFLERDEEYGVECFLEQKEAIERYYHKNKAAQKHIRSSLICFTQIRKRPYLQDCLRRRPLGQVKRSILGQPERSHWAKS